MNQGQRKKLFLFPESLLLLCLNWKNHCQGKLFSVRLLSLSLLTFPQSNVDLVTAGGDVIGRKDDFRVFLSLSLFIDLFYFFVRLFFLGYYDHYQFYYEYSKQIINNKQFDKSSSSLQKLLKNNKL